MSENRPTLLKGLLEAFKLYSKRETVGSVKTSHSAFIPAESLQDPVMDTEQFIKAARTINKHTEWGCPVTACKTEIVRVKGVEFEFHFNASTDFASIISYLENRLQES
ncbi:hypothetical protein 035JT004_231 [Bacillus phage 035JT004]|nr:hypothetical protein 035JT004_231 [Bacillus phage 035JT004]